LGNFLANPEGSSFVATLGFGLESRWDSNASLRKYVVAVWGSGDFREKDERGQKMVGRRSKTGLKRKVAAGIDELKVRKTASTGI
jgi:hypothetical protein